MSEVTGSTDTSATSSVPVEGSSEVVADTTKPLTASQKEKFKFMVDGQEFEEEIDFSDKESLKNRLQLGHAAKKRMAEASEAKKKAAEIVKAFEENPENLLRRLGPKGRELAEKYLLEQIQDEMLSPEEKEFRSTKSELQKYKDQEERAKKEQISQAQAKKENEYAQSFQAIIITALDKSGLPKTPELVKKMASIMSKNLEYGLDLTPDELIKEVKSDVVGMLQSIVKDASGEQLASMFGEDAAKKIRQFDLQRLKLRQAEGFGQKPSQTASLRKEDSGRPLTMDQWKEQISRNLKK